MTGRFAPKLPVAGSKSNFRFTPESRLNSEIAARTCDIEGRTFHIKIWNHQAFSRYVRPHDLPISQFVRRLKVPASIIMTMPRSMSTKGTTL
jgi:hypothetical protein